MRPDLRRATVARLGGRTALGAERTAPSISLQHPEVVADPNEQPAHALADDAGRGDRHERGVFIVPTQVEHPRHDHAEQKRADEEGRVQPDRKDHAECDAQRVRRDPPQRVLALDDSVLGRGVEKAQQNSSDATDGHGL